MRCRGIIVAWRTISPMLLRLIVLCGLMLPCWLKNAEALEKENISHILIDPIEMNQEYLGT